MKIFLSKDISVYTVATSESWMLYVYRDDCHSKITLVCDSTKYEIKNNMKEVARRLKGTRVIEDSAEHFQKLSINKWVQLRNKCGKLHNAFVETKAASLTIIGYIFKCRYATMYVVYIVWFHSTLLLFFLGSLTD